MQKTATSQVYLGSKLGQNLGLEGKFKLSLFRIQTTVDNSLFPQVFCYKKAADLNVRGVMHTCPIVGGWDLMVLDSWNNQQILAITFSDVFPFSSCSSSPGYFTRPINKSLPFPVWQLQPCLLSCEPAVKPSLNADSLFPCLLTALP